MDRRSALQRVALLMGGTVIGGQIFLAGGCKPANKQVANLFEADSIAFLNEVAETILPATNTPGAKEAKVGEFVPVMVRDCYSPEDQTVFLNGLLDIETKSNAKYKAGFMKITPEQRTELLNELEKEQRAYQKTKEKDTPPHYFRLMKETIMLGFFTSEVGSTKVLRYVETPGSYNGCVDYKKGDKLWA